MRGLIGKQAIVTGAANGIGRAIARRLAEEGCAVGIFDLDETGALACAGEIQAAGGHSHVELVDVTDYAAVERAVQSFESARGPADILVNNAGWDRVANFLDSDRSLWERVIRINLYGPLNTHHAVLKGMAERGSGCVVNIASDAGRVGSSGEAVYSACKGGVIALTKALARELVRKGIRVNAVAPGPTDTAFLQTFAERPDGAKILEGLKRAIPMRRLGVPEDYPGIVAFLASDDAAYITGQVISVSGGLTMVG
jgi:2-hydroxycyclohexanecarboxyl-CoA dehydrogenase